MTRQFIVFKALTTRVFGKARWICSPRLSVPATASCDGEPSAGKTKALTTSMMGRPPRCPTPAEFSAATDAVAAVALTSRSARAPASGAGLSSTVG